MTRRKSGSRPISFGKLSRQMLRNPRLNPRVRGTSRKK